MIVRIARVARLRTISRRAYRLIEPGHAPGSFFVLYDNEVEVRLWLIRKTGVVCVAPAEPQRFDDTFGMFCRRAFHRS